jgi:hypothetical protein
MLKVKLIAATLAGSALLTFAGCATTHGSLRSSADRLERNAAELARDTRDSSAASDARQLADQAHDFRRTVEDRRADDRDIQIAFEELSRDYHALRDEVDDSDSREDEIDLRPVTEAYLDIEREMNASTRYARDRDDRDRL